MEKRKPHYDLDKMQALVLTGHWVLTQTAQKNAQECFHLDADGIKAVHDHTLWQDVYQPWIQGKMAYVKLQLVDDSTVVIQFKEK